MSAPIFPGTYMKAFHVFFMNVNVSTFVFEFEVSSMISVHVHFWGGLLFKDFHLGVLVLGVD